MKNRTLGPLIRHISLDPYDYLDIPVQHAQPILDDEDDYDIVRRYNRPRWHRSFAIYGSSSTEEKKWHLRRAMRQFLEVGITKLSPIPSSLRKWLWSSAVPFFLLLAMAPNVTSVETGFSGCWELHDLSARFSGPSPAPKLTFPKVDRLQLQFYPMTLEENGDKLPAASFAALLAATPNLKSLELREFPRLGPEDPSLPHGLTSLVLIDTHATGPAFEHIVNTCFGLKRLCAYSYVDGLGDPEDASLAAHRLALLSKTTIASGLQTLVLSSTVLSPGPPAVMEKFSDLKVLGIRYAFKRRSEFEKNLEKHLLVDLVKDCPSLRGLLVAGAFRISSLALARFATAVSKKQFPNLRQVKLVCRLEHWEKQQCVVTAPISELFRAGNVELVLGTHKYEGTAQLVEEMEKACM